MGPHYGLSECFAYLLVFCRSVQDDIRRKKFSLERVNNRKDQISEKLSDITLQLDNADREQKRVVVKKQVRYRVSHDKLLSTVSI